MEYEKMEELTRDELQTVAEQLERMSLEQFEGLFQSFFGESGFREESDALDIGISMDKKYGIESLRYRHLRAYDVDDNPIDENSPEDFEVDVVDTGAWELRDIENPSTAIGANMLYLVHPVATSFFSERLMQGIYEAVLAVLTSTQPSNYIVNPTLDIPLYNHKDQNIDVTKVHGERWETPDLEPPTEKQIHRLSEEELIGAIEEINASNPMSGLKCSHLYEKCEHVEEKPSNLSWEAENEFYNKQERQHHIGEGDPICAVAVITRNQFKDEEEEWAFEDLWHEKCGPSIQEFESDYTARKSIGKDEVFSEGVVKAGKLQQTEFGDYYEMHVTDIEIVARKGDYAADQ